MCAVITTAFRDAEAAACVCMLLSCLKMSSTDMRVSEQARGCLYHGCLSFPDAGSKVAV